jgi:chorismate mutase
VVHVHDVLVHLVVLVPAAVRAHLLHQRVDVILLQQAVLTGNEDKCITFMLKHNC